MSLSPTLQRRQKLRWRIRAKVSGTTARPRLSVFRSNKDIYLQLVDDADGRTLAAASSREAAITAQGGPKVDRSAAAGKLLAERAKAAGIETCTFDRGGYLYHGRVKAAADGAREGGLVF